MGATVDQGAQDVQRLLDGLHLVKRGAIGVTTGDGFQFLEGLPARHGAIVTAVTVVTRGRREIEFLSLSPKMNSSPSAGDKRDDRDDRWAGWVRLSRLARSSQGRGRIAFSIRWQIPCESSGLVLNLSVANATEVFETTQTAIREFDLSNLHRLQHFIRRQTAGKPIDLRLINASRPRQPGFHYLQGGFNGMGCVGHGQPGTGFLTAR